MKVYVDVGGTLLLGADEHRSPLNQPLIAALKNKLLHQPDMQIVVWSFYGAKTSEVVGLRAFGDDINWVYEPKEFQNVMDGDVIIDDDTHSLESLAEYNEVANKFVVIFSPEAFIEVWA